MEEMEPVTIQAEPEEEKSESSRWYEVHISLEDAKTFIKANITTAARSFIAIGFYLKCVRDRELFQEEGYQDIWEFAKSEYGISKSTASRYMSMNDRFSENGNSPNIREEYKAFGKSQLQEMLSLEDEQLEQVRPEYRVEDIRNLRKPKEVPYIELPGQLDFETDFPDILPLSQFNQEDLLAIPQNQTFEMSVEDLLAGEEQGVIAISQQESSAFMNASCITGLSPYGSCVCCGANGVKCCGQCEESCNGRCGWLEDGLKEEQEKIQEHDICHFTAKQESIDDAYGWTWSELVKKYLEVGYKSLDKECEVVSLGQTYKILKREGVTVFYDANGKTLFDVENERLEQGYIYFFRESHAPEIVPKHPISASESIETVPESSENVIDGEFEEIPSDLSAPVKTVLEEAKKTLKDWMSAFEGEVPEKWPPFIERQKIIVAALAAMVCDLEETTQPEKPEQPELPLLKNNDQRAAFIDAYETWPIWIETKETGERYYRYDLSDKAAIVVKVYWKHSWTSYKESKDYEYGAEHYYLMGVKSEWHNGKNAYVEDDTRSFYECGTNRSALVEYLKEFQKSR